MQSRNRIFKLVVPLLFVTLIGAFVAFNSGWLSKSDKTPKVPEKTEKLESIETPLIPQKTDEPLTVEKETSEKSKTKLIPSPVESFGTDTSQPVSREIIMSSSKSMKVELPTNPFTIIDYEQKKFEERKKIMSSTKSVIVLPITRFDTQPGKFIYKPREKIMPSTKSMPIIDRSTKTKKPN